MSSPITTAGEAAAYLESLINVERMPDRSGARFSLAPIRRLLERVLDPHLGMSVIHIAGSKGKGSTALFVEALLRALGTRVGTYTSPHLERWTERFRIDGVEVEGQRLAATVEKLRPHLDELRESDPERAPSFFDATTAAAFLLFAEAELDHVVLEVGLGGRLDSTNVVQPAVTCVTSIELEHTRTLGDSLAAIAAEKAGILKAGVPVVMGSLPEEAASVVRGRAEALGCPLAELGVDFRVELGAIGPDGFEVRLLDGDLDVRTRLGSPAAHQGTNAALALACLRRLDVAPDGRLAEVAAATLPGVNLPGRVEVLSTRPWVVVDAAHTAASASALAQALARFPRRRLHLVLSVSEGKDLAAICGCLAPLADEITLTRAEPTRSLAPEEVAEALRIAAPDARTRVVPNPHLALRAAREALGPEDLLCATGSIYLAGLARRILLAWEEAPAGAASRRPAAPLAAPEKDPSGL